MTVNLAKFDNSSFNRGRSALVELAWILVQALLIRSFVPGSWHRRALLRLFGARIAQRVVVKPGLRVKFPWRLEIGADSWIGEDVWIDNLAEVKIGSNCCISQSAYFCTGSHDWSKPRFDLVARAITIGDAVWIAANAAVAPGTVIGEGAVVGLGSVASGHLEAWSIYRGNPAVLTGRRTVTASSTEIGNSLQ